MSGALPLTATRRNLPKRQRAVARSQICCTVQAEAAGEAVRLQLGLHDHQLVVLEQVAVRH
jgi:hypothetical protein